MYRMYDHIYENLLGYSNNNIYNRSEYHKKLRWIYSSNDRYADSGRLFGVIYIRIWPEIAFHIYIYILKKNK